MNWPEADVARLSTDVAPGSGNLVIFPGYSMFLNFNTVLANGG